MLRTTIMSVRMVLGPMCMLLATALQAQAQSASSSAILPRETLVSEIEYQYAGNLGLIDDQGRKLVWVGTIKGDLNGTMRWWFGPAPTKKVTYNGGSVSYYAGRWEIWDEEGENLLLAGESAGKTVTPTGIDGMWDGHGVVTEASGRLNVLKGSRIYETGPVQKPSEPDVPLYGRGIFLIY